MHGALPEVVASVCALLREAPAEGVERSFKFLPGTLLGDRLLAGWSLERTGTSWALEACRRLGMPPDAFAAFGASLGEADVVHFGYEADAGRTLLKAYLEFPARLVEGSGDPVLLHTAWKWSADEPGDFALAHYRCLPGLTLAAIDGRVGRLDGGPSGALLRDLAALAGERSPEPLMYLEVSEEGNPRASFDLNVHAAGLALRDVEPQLRGLRAHFGVPEETFAACFLPVRGARLGHVSGGRSRSGSSFATIYYAGGAA